MTSLRDQDFMLDRPGGDFGSGVVGVCDVCQKRQAVIILQKERFKLCVIDFLNKTWLSSKSAPGAPLPAYRSDRIWFDTAFTKDGKAPAVVLSPTKVVRHPTLLITPDIYGLTTTVLDAAIRFAREGFEVLMPDVLKTARVGPREHLSIHTGVLTRGRVPLDSPRVERLLNLYADALRHLRTREMVDPEKSAVFGASFGASLAIGVAAHDQKLGAMALAYPIPVRPPNMLTLVTAPTLLVRGGKDSRGRKAEEQFRPAFRSGGVPLEVTYYAAGSHNFLSRDLRSYDMVVAEEAWRRIVSFVKARLIPPPIRPPAPPIRITAPPPTGTPAVTVGKPSPT